MCFRPAESQSATKKCPKCGSENDYFSAECAECGEALAGGAPSTPGAPKAPSAPIAPGAPKPPGAPKAPGAK